MGYIIDGDVHGKVFGIIETDNPLNQEEQDIIDAVAAEAHHVIGEHHYYDATGFVTSEIIDQGVEATPRSVDLSKFTGWHSDIDLPVEMFADTQWIKED